MILHNITLAWRNLTKYKLQNTLSVVALAVGMTTLACTHFVVKHLAAPAICDQPHYSRTYVIEFETPDHRHSLLNKDAQKALDVASLPGVEEVHFRSPFWLISTMTFVLPDKSERNVDFSFFLVDEGYYNHNGIHSALTGDVIPVLNEGEIVLSEYQSSLVFGDKNPVGTSVYLQTTQTVEPFIIRDVYKHESLADDVSNVALICPRNDSFSYEGQLYQYHLVCKEKFMTEQIEEEANRRLAPFGIMSKVSSMKDYISEASSSRNMTRTIVYLISSLILLAALTGYLKMQLQLFRMRSREVALRRSHGATRKNLLILFFTEIAMTLLASFIAAILLAQWIKDFTLEHLDMILKEFGWKFEGIELSICIITAVVALIAIVSVFTTLRRMCNPQQSMAAAMHRSNRHVLRNSILGLQVTVCMLFIGCTLALTQYIGNIMVMMNIPDNNDHYAECIILEPKSHDDIEKIDEYLHHKAKNIRRSIEFSEEASVISEAPEDGFGEYLNATFLSDTAYFSFWEHPIRWLVPEKERKNCILLSESLYSAYEKRGLTANGTLTIENTPTLPIGGTFPTLPYVAEYDIFDVQKMVIIMENTRHSTIKNYIIEPEEGMYDEVFAELEMAMKEINPTVVEPTVKNLHKTLTDDASLFINMQHGAWLLSGICFVICLMGVWSSISLDTRSRQKEVAVRKVHGAKRKDIVRIFGRLYIRLIAIACIVSIPLIILFNELIFVAFGALCDLNSALLPIVYATLVISLVILLIVGKHIRAVMKVNPANIIAKE